MNCEILGTEESFKGTCFGHAFFEACQYGKIEEIFYKKLKHISIKLAKSNLQKCITWPKKSIKKNQEWTKACSDSGIHPRKLNTPIKTRFFLNYFLKK
jgi:hypothetical protein